MGDYPGADATPDDFWSSAVGKFDRVPRAVEFDESRLEPEELEIIRREREAGRG